MHKNFTSVKELSAFEQGYATAIADLLQELDDSKLKVLSLMLDTEPYTSQRRMLLACEKLLKIYTEHYQGKLRNLTEHGVDILALL